MNIVSLCTETKADALPVAPGEAGSRFSMAVRQVLYTFVRRVAKSLISLHRMMEFFLSLPICQLAGCIL
jgi:hypothetical protein